MTQIFAALVLTATPLLTAGKPYTPNETVVVDGDTLKVDGTNIRISNLDTPERGGRAECDAERFLSAIATRRAEDIVATKAIIIWPEGRADKYDRPLARVTADGEEWADIFVAENLGVPWAGRQHDWCGATE